MIQSNNLKAIKQKQLKVLYMTTLVLFLPIFGAFYYSYSTSEKPEVVEIIEDSITPIAVDLSSVVTKANSAYVVSLSSGLTFYEKQPNKLLPLASITKLVTAKVAQDNSTDSLVSVKKMPDPTYGDMKLIEGTLWAKNDLIAYTLMTSSNDGAHSLSANTSTAFVDSMNKLVATIGLTSTRFYNETGLDNDSAGIPGSKGTARDVSLLLSYLIKNNIQLFEKTKYDSVVVSSPEGITRASNTNQVTDSIVGLLVSKTGYTDIAGGNLAIVADMGLNEPTAFVVLHSSKEARFQDVLSLQNEYFAQVANRLR